jgi:DsbC/DsbD-like thiol-disulfide interchange protein
MKNILLLFILTFSLLKSQNAIKIQEVVKWKTSFVSSENNLGEIQITGTIQPDWHVYSINPTADGPVPTTITFEPSANYELKGGIREPQGEKKIDEAFGVEIKSFSGEVIFSQSIQRKSKSAFTIKGTVEFMTCNNVQCNPPRTIAFVVGVPSIP